MKLVVLNHKMNLEYEDLDKYIDDLKKINLSNIKLVVCPTDVYLSKFIESGFVCGSQNVSFDLDGAYTGEMSALQLKSLGIKYSIVGHSERRKYFNEDNTMICRKTKLLLDEKIIPILCIGESLEDKEKERTKEIIKNQIVEVLDYLNNISSIVIAYEPVWAIGSGFTPSMEDVEEIVSFIKMVVFKRYGVDIKVLYGGSVSDDNIHEFEKLDILDGYLLGTVSLYPDKLSNLTRKL